MNKKVFYLFQAVFLLSAIGFLSAESEKIIINQSANQFYSHTDYLEDPNNWARYAPQNLFDGKTNTSWAIGDGGLGTAIYVSIPLNARAIKIINGYAENADLFAKNNRVKTIKTELCAAYSFPDRASEYGRIFDVDRLGNEKTFILQDTITEQSLSLGSDYWQKTDALIDKSKTKFDIRLTQMAEREKEFFEEGLIFLLLLRIEIVDVYKGSRWNDTCLSELAFEYETRSVPDKKAIVGFWETIRGADYEEIDFGEDGYVFAYSGTRPFDSGRWSIGSGMLIIQWEYSKTVIYTSFYRKGKTLTLTSTDGTLVVLSAM